MNCEPALAMDRGLLKKRGFRMETNYENIYSHVDPIVADD